MVVCPSCSNNIDNNNFIRKYFSKIANMEYKLYHCENCDIQFWMPLEFVKSIYEDQEMGEYFLWHRGLDLDIKWNHKYFVKFFLKDVKNNLKGNKVLDIGCGNGSFINFMSKEGFEVYGIDMDSKSIDAATKNFNLKNLFSMSLRDFTSYAIENNLKFDLITFFEVLEHQTDVQGFFDSIKTLLHEDGIIVGTVPNRNRVLYWFIMGDGDFPPHHFLWFSKSSLENLFKNKGFKPYVVATSINEGPSLKRLNEFLYQSTKIEVFNYKKYTSIFHKIFRSIFLLVFYPLAILKRIDNLLGYPCLFFMCSRERE